MQPLSHHINMQYAYDNNMQCSEAVINTLYDQRSNRANSQNNYQTFKKIRKKRKQLASIF